MPSKLRDRTQDVKYHYIKRTHMAKVKRSGVRMPEGMGGKRKAVQTLSVASGLRLQETIASVDPKHGYPLFVHLTYPGEYPKPKDWREWKRHLHNFRRHLLITFGDQLIGASWRIEAQRRGAPHYHLLIWLDLGDMSLKDFKSWVSRKWYKIVGSGDERHLRAGTRVEEVTGHEGMTRTIKYVTKYLGKNSVGKESQLFNVPIGRYWGVWNKQRLLKEPETIEMSGKLYRKARRILRKHRESAISEENKKRKAKGKRLIPKKYKGREKLNNAHNRKMPGLRAFLPAQATARLIEWLHNDVPF